MNDDTRWLKFALSLSGFLAALFFMLSGFTLYGGRWFDRADPVANVALSDPLPVDQLASALYIMTAEQGIVAVREAQVEEKQLPFSTFSADSLSLTYNDVPIAFYVDSRDPDNETLYFYAEGATDALSAPPVYRLSNKQGAAMRERDGEPTAPGVLIGMRTKLWEENTRFFPLATGDQWLGRQIFAPSTQTYELDDIAPSGGEGLLMLKLWSSSATEANPDHHIEVHLNGQRLIEKYWDGITHVSSEKQLMQDMLLPSDNLLAITALGDMSGGGESVYVDTIQLTYEGFLALGNNQLQFESAAENLMISGATEDTLLFDISDPQMPVRLTNTRIDSEGMSFAGAELGATFIALRADAAIEVELLHEPIRDRLLRSADNGADYIAIVPDNKQFASTLEPLLAHRRAQGLTAEIVSLEQIYDEFSFGHQTPIAIRDFLHFAAENWSVAPRFVLLVGDASYDLHQFLDGDNQNVLSAQLAHNTIDGLIASDGVLTEWEPGVFAEQVAIGRFPVQNRQQLATLVRKTIAYETAIGDDMNWTSRALLVSDDEPEFVDHSAAFATMLRDSGYRSLRLDMQYNENIRDSIISAINQGIGILNYVGNGDLEVWGDERVLRGSDSTSLINGSRLPIFTTWTTRNGAFNHPFIDTLAEQLLWADNGGIVAAIAPAGRIETNAQTAFGDHFYQQLLANPDMTLGETLQTARRQMVSTEAGRSINLLGDPALRLRAPSSE